MKYQKYLIIFNMQIKNPVLQRRANIQAMFQNSNTYRQSNHNYLTQVKAENSKIIIDIIYVIKNILNNQAYSPFSKLLTIRFIRQCIFTCSYAFLTLLNTELCSLLFDFASFKKSNSDPERGKQLFIGYPGRQFEKEYLKTIGFSFHKIILETFMYVGKWLKKCPYQRDPSLPSQIAKSYHNLITLGVKFPEESTYYHRNDGDRFLSFYTSNLGKTESINNFYDFLFSQLDLSQNFEPTLKIIENIIKSGDMFCIQKIINKIRLLIENEGNTSSKANYMEIINHIFCIGELETIVMIEKYLLKDILEAYLQKKLPYSYTYQISSWGYLVHNIEGFPEEIDRLFLKISQHLKGCQKKEILPLKKNFYYKTQLLKKMNIEKQEFLDFNNPNEEYIVKILEKIPQKKEEKNLIRLEVHTESIGQNMVNLKKLKSNQSYFINSDHQSSTPRRRFSKCSQNSELKTLKDQHKSEKSPLFVESLKLDSRLDMNECFRDAKNLTASRKIVKKYQEKRMRTEGENQSCPNFSEHRSDKQTEKFKKEVSEFDEYQMKINTLEKQVLQKGMNEEKLKKIIAEKEKEIEKLKSTHSQFVKSRESIPSSDHIISFNSQSLIQKSTLSAEFIPEKTIDLSTKTKSQILKKKVLVMKNSDIEIGIISNCQLNKLATTIYITPLINLYNIQTKLNCPVWLSQTIFQENLLKKQARAEFQYTIRVEFSLKSPLKNIYLFPQLFISYSKRKDNVTKIKSFLPIFITKFYEEKAFNDEQFSILSNKKNNLNKCQMRIQSKFLKDFQHFKKYFSEAKEVEARKIFAVKLEFQRREIYLTLKMLEGRNAILSLIGKDGRKDDLGIKVFSCILGM